ncbi:MAG TPA: DciA family protein [Sporichthyaceae bacterium]|nr:DciA family protein [Sporichthyaceae bacterium]
MSDDEQTPAAPPAAPDQPAGLDLARAALADARDRARKTTPRRTRRPASPVVRVRGDESRDPQLFGAVLGRLVTDRGWTAPAEAVGVVDRWPELVGSDIAERTEAESLTDGVLVVRAVSTAWATQLRLMAPDILRRLNTELGHNTVTRLDVRGPAAPNWVKGPLRARDSRGPRDTYG